MGDEESSLLQSKKRVAGRQISKDNPDPDDDASEPEMGTFQKASDEVMATRRIVKVRRHQPPSAASSNPFAGIRLVPPSDSSAKNSPTDQPQSGGDTVVLEEQKNSNEKSEITVVNEGTESAAVVNKVEPTEDNSKKSEDVLNVRTTKAGDEVKSDAAEGTTEPAEDAKEVENIGNETDKEVRKGTDEEGRNETEREAREETEEPVKEETENEKQESEKKDTATQAAPLNSFQQLSSHQNAFTGLTGTGFSTSSFSFGVVAKEGSTFGASSGSLFGLRNENSSLPSFGIVGANNGSSSSPLLSTAPDTAKKLSMQEVPLETGEENEKPVFIADAALYEYLDGGWKERGKGELKVNVSISGPEKARVIMRAKGNYRLILNANLYPDMSLTNMDKKGITFACANSAGEGKTPLTTFALKFKDSSTVEEFRMAVAAHKGEKGPLLKTPENSPKASED